MAGYSGAPLAKKLGIKQGSRVLLADAPSNYLKLVAPLPHDVRFDAEVTEADVIHVFSTDRAVLRRTLARYRPNLKPAAAVWVSWPKRAAKVQTDITEDTVRQVALPLGFVDVKVCAIDNVWSGLKLVVRKQLRPHAG
jgi:hypothetical protein